MEYYIDAEKDRLLMDIVSSVHKPKINKSI